jgi:hypothetical protein
MVEPALPLLILVVGAAGLTVLWRVGAWVPASVRNFRRLARRHGIAVEAGFAERVLGSTPGVGRLLREPADIDRLLALAGRAERAPAWCFQSAGVTVLAVAVLLVLDLATWAANGTLAYPIYLAFLFGGAWLALRYVRLRNAAVARRRALERALSQSFVELALLTSTRQVPVEAALEDLLVQAQEDRELRELLQQGAWRRLVPRGAPAGSLGFDRGPLTSHAAIYDAIGAAYGVPAFALLGSSLQRINDKGQSPGEVLTALARTSAENEVAEMLVRSEQARIRQAIPVGLMIVPLLVLVGYPLLTAMSTALGT